MSNDKDKFTQEELSEMDRTELFRMAVGLGLPAGENFTIPFAQLVDYVFEHQGDAPEKTKEETKEPKKTKRRVGKTKTAEKEEKAAPRGRGSRSTSTDKTDATVNVGPLQKRVDANAAALSELQKTLDTVHKGSSESIDALYDTVSDLRCELWVVRELIVRFYKVFEGPAAVDRVLGELDEQSKASEEGNG